MKVQLLELGPKGAMLEVVIKKLKLPTMAALQTKDGDDSLSLEPAAETEAVIDGDKPSATVVKTIKVTDGNSANFTFSPRAAARGKNFLVLVYVIDPQTNRRLLGGLASVAVGPLPPEIGDETPASNSPAQATPAPKVKTPIGKRRTKRVKTPIGVGPR